MEPWLISQIGILIFAAFLLVYDKIHRSRQIAQLQATNQMQAARLNAAVLLYNRSITLIEEYNRQKEFDNSKSEGENPHSTRDLLAKFREEDRQSLLKMTGVK